MQDRFLASDQARNSRNLRPVGSRTRSSRKALKCLNAMLGFLRRVRKPRLPIFVLILLVLTLKELHHFHLLASVGTWLLPLVGIAATFGGRPAIVAACSSGIVIALLSTTGLYRPSVDNFVLVLSAGIAIWLFTRLDPLWPFGGIRPLFSFIRRTFKVAVCVVLAWWIYISIPVFWPSATIPSLGALQQSHKVPSSDVLQGTHNEVLSRVKIAIALSGGGYRAALMHAGVLDAAEHFGIPITHVSSVSGGSIIASYYALGGTPRQFLHLVESGRFDLRRELVRMQNLLRLPFPFEMPHFGWRLFPWYSFSRADVQATLLDRALLGRRALADIGRDRSPQLVICATDLRTGTAYGFTNAGVITRPPVELADKHRYQNLSSRPDFSLSDFRQIPEEVARDIPLAKIVAASGAFPVAFAPVPLTVDYQQFERRDSMHLLLVDGGIADNSGIDLLLDLYREAGDTVPLLSDTNGIEWHRPDNWQFDYLIASDASEVFSSDVEKPGFGGLGRALDIVYRNVRSRERQPPVYAPQPFLLSPEKYLMQMPHPAGESLEAWRAFLYETATFASLPQDALRFLAENASTENDYTVTELQLPGYEEMIEALSRGRKALKENANIDDARAYLAGALNTEMALTLRTFSETSTLEDYMSPITARRLFRLGQYLFALNWRELRSRITTAGFFNWDSEHDWSELLDTVPQLTRRFPPRSRVPDRGLLDLSFPPLLANGPVFGSEDSAKMKARMTAAISGRSSPEEDTERRAISDIRNMRQACVAHRLAHAVSGVGPFRSRQLPGIPGKIVTVPISSLMEELRGNVEIDSQAERIVDEATIRLLCGAGMSPKGLPKLMRAMVDRYGHQAVHPDLSARLLYAENIASCSSDAPRLHHDVKLHTAR
jgi:predicted acylesterase/phospholipase RssA